MYALSVVLKVPLFKLLDMSFLKDLSMKVESFIFIPGEFIVYANEPVNEMYVINKGICEVCNIHLSQLIPNNDTEMSERYAFSVIDNNISHICYVQILMELN